MEQIPSASAGNSFGIVLKNSLSVISALSLYSFHDPPNANATNSSVYDYIVVGAGTSGCVVASRLTEVESMRVLLLEAGGNTQLENVIPRLRRLTPNSRLDWNYTTESDKNYSKCHLDSRCPRLSGKVLGGLSAVDMLHYSQGREADYNAWAKITNDSSWSYPNVLRLFKKVENFNDTPLKKSPNALYHGFNGVVGISKESSPILDLYYEAFGQIGKKKVGDINSRTKYGVTDVAYYIKNNIRQSSAWTYLYRAKHRRNLDVIKNILVTKILFEGKRAIGVEAVDQNNNRLVFKANFEVIVSAGTFNSPKLLQLSGIGPASLLGPLGINVISDLPVGQNYHTHTSTVVIAATKKTNRKLVPEDIPLDPPLPTMVSYSEVSGTDQQFKEYRAIISIVPVTPATIFQLYGSTFTNLKYSIINKWVSESKGRELMMINIENTKVASRGTVYIRSTDPLDPPRINGNFYSNKTDVHNMIQYMRDIRRIIDAPVLKKEGAFFIDPEECNSFEFGSDDYYECYVRCIMVPLAHDCGTTAMGSVVDGAMLVKGVQGLRVVGASIMPETTAGSITIPSMMIGEMAAERIKKSYFPLNLKPSANLELFKFLVEKLANVLLPNMTY